MLAMAPNKELLKEKFAKSQATLIEELKRECTFYEEALNNSYRIHGQPISAKQLVRKSYAAAHLQFFFVLSAASKDEKQRNVAKEYKSKADRESGTLGLSNYQRYTLCFAYEDFFKQVGRDKEARLASETATAYLMQAVTKLESGAVIVNATATNADAKNGTGLDANQAAQQLATALLENTKKYLGLVTEFAILNKNNAAKFNAMIKDAIAVVTCIKPEFSDKAKIDFLQEVKEKVNLIGNANSEEINPKATKAANHLLDLFILRLNLEILVKEKVKQDRKKSTSPSTLPHASEDDTHQRISSVDKKLKEVAVYLCENPEEGDEILNIILENLSVKNKKLYLGLIEKEINSFQLKSNHPVKSLLTRRTGVILSQESLYNNLINFSTSRTTADQNHYLNEIAQGYPRMKRFEIYQIAIQTAAEISNIDNRNRLCEFASEHLAKAIENFETGAVVYNDAKEGSSPTQKPADQGVNELLDRLAEKSRGFYHILISSNAEKFQQIVKEALDRISCPEPILLNQAKIAFLVKAKQEIKKRPKENNIIGKAVNALLDKNIPALAQKPTAQPTATAAAAAASTTAINAVDSKMDAKLSPEADTFRRDVLDLKRKIEAAQDKEEKSAEVMAVNAQAEKLANCILDVNEMPTVTDKLTVIRQGLRAAVQHQYSHVRLQDNAGTEVSWQIVLERLLQGIIGAIEKKLARQPDTWLQGDLQQLRKKQTKLTSASDPQQFIEAIISAVSLFPAQTLVAAATASAAVKPVVPVVVKLRGKPTNYPSTDISTVAFDIDDNGRVKVATATAAASAGSAASAVTVAAVAASAAATDSKADATKAAKISGEVNISEDELAGLIALATSTKAMLGAGNSIAFAGGKAPTVAPAPTPAAATTPTATL
jgi:hypothetical protein